MKPPVVTRGMRDGVEIHKAALRAGFSTRLLPRQVLLVDGPAGESTAFTHGIPQYSTLSGVTFTQDLRMRRGLLGKAGLQQPRGATFSIGKSRASIRNYAARLGYPVVVKPALGDSTIDVIRGIRGSTDLEQALNALLVPPEERPDSTRAAYGITELRAPGLRDGRVTVPPGYRVLVEEQLSGRYLRILVLDGEPINVVEFEEDPWGETQLAETVTDLPRTVLEAVAGVVSALPGLAVSAIDVVVTKDDDERPQSVCVVDVSERPWLEVQHRLDRVLCENLADEVLRSGIAAAGRRQMSPQKLDIRFRGVVSPEALCHVIEEHAEGLGIDVQLHVTSMATGEVAGTVASDCGVSAELAELVVGPGISGQTAMQAELRQATM